LTLFVLIVGFWQGIFLLKWFLINKTSSSQSDLHYSTLVRAVYHRLYSLFRFLFF
jgi:hypothetical protein